MQTPMTPPPQTTTRFGGGELWWSMEVDADEDDLIKVLSMKSLVCRRNGGSDTANITTAISFVNV